MSRLFETQKCIVGLLTCFKIGNLSAQEIAEELEEFDDKTRNLIYQIAFNNGEKDLALLIEEANQIIDKKIKGNSFLKKFSINK